MVKAVLPVRRRWVATARGDVPADLVLSGGSVLSVFTGEVFRADVAIVDGYVVGIGEYEGVEMFDCTDRYLVPGFIDGHCHIESSKLNVTEFARAVVRRGTTSVVVDPHELANVLGIEGVEYILSASKDLPLGVYVKMPSCVPASPFESPAFVLEACDFEDLLRRQRVIGIAEMMNYPATIAGDPAVMAKMAATGYRQIDGHAPGVTGKALNAYLVAGPSSDHECTTVEEALEKRRLGMWIMIREASMIRNLVDLLPLVMRYGTENCMFVTDDREAGTLLDEGHVNSMVRTAVKYGLAPGDAVKLATLNVARYHGLHDQGAIAPGFLADIAVMADLSEFEPAAVFKRGRLVAEGGNTLDFPAALVPAAVTGSVHARRMSAEDFRLPDPGTDTVRLIRLIPNQVITAAGAVAPARIDGFILADPTRDLAKLAVVERHHATGRTGLGLVTGFGLMRGAFASTVAHDAHNIIVVGMDDEAMATCVQRITQIGGGLVVARDGDVLGELPLEIAGLMSTLPAAAVAGKIRELEEILASMGVSIETPFMYLSFLALSVIPELRLTDNGLVDVRSFSLVPLGIS